METIILILVILLVLWLLGFFGHVNVGPISGNAWHVILVIAVILLIVWLVTGRSIF